MGLNPIGRSFKGKDMKTLDKLPINYEAYVDEIKCDDVALRQHILNMGITPNVEILLVKKAPMGDPLEFRVRGYELSLRKDDASKITIKKRVLPQSNTLTLQSYQPKGCFEGIPAFLGYFIAVFPFLRKTTRVLSISVSASIKFFSDSNSV